MARRLTYEEVKNFIEVESGSGCKLLSEEYKNMHTKLKLKCKCGSKFETTFDNFKRNSKQQCNRCGGRILWNFTKVKQFIEIESKSGCKLLSDKYVSYHEELKMECMCGSRFTTTFAKFRSRNKRQCDECGYTNKRKGYAYNIQYVKQYIENNSNCKLLSHEYINAKSNLKIRCHCGNIFQTNFDSFKSKGKRQCTDCGIKNTSNAKRLKYKDVKHFIEIESQSDCRLLSKKYTGVSDKLLIQCSCGNDFETNFNEFKHGNKRQCNDCTNVKMSNFFKAPIKLIKDEIRKYGYIPLFDTYINSDIPMLCLNSEGYKVMVRLGNIRNGISPRAFSNSNPYTIDNIEHYIKTNNLSCQIISKNFDYFNKLKFKCECGRKFETLWDTFYHESKNRCEGCTKIQSNGEHAISEFLSRHNINYEQEYRFNDCKHTYSLPFDFYLSDYNMLIEYDGEQHFKAIKHFGGKEKFKRQQKNDNIKNQYCKDNNIPLLRIPYWDFDNIEQILEDWLESHGIYVKQTDAV